MRRRRQAPYVVGIALAVLGVTCRAFDADTSMPSTFDGGLDAAQAHDVSSDDVTSKLEAPADASADSAPRVVFTAGTTWETPNGAEWTIRDGGTVITGLDSTNLHPIIFPVPQLAIEAQDYTVEATIFAPSGQEFGILTRVQPDGSAVVLASGFGGESIPMLGRITRDSSWNVGKDAVGAGYDAGAMNVRYRLRVTTMGHDVIGKFWNASDEEPVESIRATIPWDKGVGVGFYSYGLTGALLERLTVTVP